ncbi:MAG: hypothetical protein LBC68_09370 [Prevotellaceae bacterium]|jgi:hypothetical protein|nr:hypothetical protein [Prevotellaceae bacterium]
MKKLYIILFTAISLFACRKDIVLSDKPEDVFTSFWRIMNDNYAYFEEKGIDWDSVYSIYYPKAKQIRHNDDLLNLFEEILRKINDEQVDIAYNNMYRLEYIISGNTWALRNYVARLDWGEAKTNFFKKVRYYDFMQDSVKKYGCIQYLGFNEKVIENIENTDYKNGLILDIRNSYYEKNIDEMLLYVSSFFNGSRIPYYELQQKGQSLDFTSKIPVIISGNGWVLDNTPVILLTSKINNNASVLFIQIMKTLPNCIVIGEKTGDIALSGTQSEILSNRWQVLYPVNITKRHDLENNCIDFGVEPDIYVKQFYSNEVADNDTSIKDSTIIKAILLLDSINGF